VAGRLGFPSLLGANYNTTPNTNDVYYVSPKGQGGVGDNDPGDPGMVVLLFGE
jgi:hypothetical protein